MGASIYSALSNTWRSSCQLNLSTLNSKKIAADLATLAASVKTAGVHKASDYQAKAGHYANDTLNDALDMSRNAFDDLRSEFGSIEKAVVGRVRAHPLQAAIGIIGGLALLVALSSRRQ